MMRSEVRALPFGLDAELLRHRVEQVDLESLNCLAVSCQKLVGRIARVGADLDDSGALDALRQLGG